MLCICFLGKSLETSDSLHKCVLFKSKNKQQLLKKCKWLQNNFGTYIIIITKKIAIHSEWKNPSRKFTICSLPYTKVNNI